MKRSSAIPAVLCLMSGFAIGLTPQPAGAQTPMPDPAEAAVRAAERVIENSGPADLLRRGPHDRFLRQSVTTGPTGLQYAAYERTYRGLPVIGGDFVITTDAAGKVLNTSVAQRRSLDLDTTPAISADAARATARTTVASIDTVTSPRLVVLATGQRPVLAWETTVTGRNSDNTPSSRQVVVDARTGTILAADEQVKADAGKGYYNGDVTFSTTQVSGTTYKMTSTSAPGLACGGVNGQVYQRTFAANDKERVWGNGSGTDLETACVDAMYAAETTKAMLGALVNRNGIDGKGKSFPIRVGLDEVNAYWAGDHAEFGHSEDGQRQATALDVIGHELGHALYQTTPGRAGFSGESSALNEGTADISGTLTEHHANNPNDKFDYEIGELLKLRGKTMRYQYKPSTDGKSPDCYSSNIQALDPHYGAGPLNHWFYLLSEGSNPTNGMPASPTCNGSTIAGGVGPEKAMQIFYSALLAKTFKWSYSAVRTATLVAAKSYSDQCQTFNRVQSAWNAVSVPAQSVEPTCR